MTVLDALAILEAATLECKQRDIYTPEVKEAMAKQGNTIDVSTPDYAAAFFPSELAKYARIVKASGAKVD